MVEVQVVVEIERSYGERIVFGGSFVLVHRPHELVSTKVQHCNSSALWVQVYHSKFGDNLPKPLCV